MAAAKKPPSPYETIISAPIGSPAWLNAYDRLSPQDQAAIVQMAIGSPTTTGSQNLGAAGTQYDFGSAYQGANAPQLDPTSQALVQFGGGVNIPSLSSAGKLEPYDLGQESARNTLFKNQVNDLYSLERAALFGPGAYDPTVFDPIMPTERLATPGIDYLNSYTPVDPQTGKSMGGTDWKSFLAQAMKPTTMGGLGMNDAEALAALRDAVTNPGDPNDPRTIALAHSMPPNPYTGGSQGNQLQLPSQTPGVAAGGVQVQPGSSLYPALNALPEQVQAAATSGQQVITPFDWNFVSAWAGDAYRNVLADQSAIATGWQDPNNPNVYYKTPPEDSPETKAFHEAGLPTPTETYTDPKYIQMYQQTYIPEAATTPDPAITAQAVQARFEKAKQDSLQADLSDQELQKAWTTHVAARDAYDTARARQAQESGAYGAANVVGAMQPQGGSVTPDVNQPPDQTQDWYTQLLSNQYVPTKTPDMQPYNYPADPTQAYYTQMLGNQYIPPGGSTANIGDLYTPRTTTTSHAAAPDPGYLFDLGNNRYGTAADAQRAVQANRPVSQMASVLPSGWTRSYQPQVVTQKQVNESRVQRQAADRRFIQANTDRFRNLTAATGPSQQAVNALFNMVMSRTTPFQDIMAQRLLGGRAVGLRGA